MVTASLHLLNALTFAFLFFVPLQLTPQTGNKGKIVRNVTGQMGRTAHVTLQRMCVLMQFESGFPTLRPDCNMKILKPVHRLNIRQ
jgi:hypothetical protein